MQFDDPYRELGVTPHATDAELKLAWRKLSARWHPDRNPSPHAVERIQRINRALEAIRREREAAAGPEAPRPPAGDAAAAVDEQAVEHAIGLTLEEAALGCIREVSGELPRRCVACEGHGRAAPVPCAACGGEGRLRQPLWFGWVAPSVGCAECSGAGTLQPACTACEGTGAADPIRYRGQIRTPGGLRDGDRLEARVPREPGTLGPQLLDLRVRLLPHEFFTLDGDGTVRADLPVDGLAWVAQRWIEVPTLDGLRPMRLQRGALTYRIKEAGFPKSLGGPRGDCLVTIDPLFPEEWTAPQSALLDRLVAANTGDVSTAAGERVQAWNQRLAAWERRRG